MVLHPLLVAFLVPPSTVGLLQNTGQQATGQRAPRDHADAVVPGGREHLELDVPGEQVVVRLLADQALEVPAGRRLEHNRERIERHRPALQAYEDACREWGSAPADVGLAWLLHQPGVTAPIVGPRTMEQFEGSLRALDVRLDEAQLARLDEIVPGYQAAPMEYAW